MLLKKPLSLMETLTNEEVMALIKRGIEFKTELKQPTKTNISSQTFLNLQLYHKAFEVELSTWSVTFDSLIFLKHKLCKIKVGNTLLVPS